MDWLSKKIIHDLILQAKKDNIPDDDIEDYVNKRFLELRNEIIKEQLNELIRGRS